MEVYDRGERHHHTLLHAGLATSLPVSAVEDAAGDGPHQSDRLQVQRSHSLPVSAHLTLIEYSLSIQILFFSGCPEHLIFSVFFPLRKSPSLFKMVTLSVSTATFSGVSKLGFSWFHVITSVGGAPFSSYNFK